MRWFIPDAIDDIVVFGRTRAEFLQNLKEVLVRLHKAKLRINPAKTTLAATKIDYLGWTITQEGRSVSPDRLEAIKALKEPRNVAEVRSLLGLLNYFRHLVPRYADVSEALACLTRTGVPFNWGSLQKEALASIKETLLSNEVLAHVKPEADLHLFTDASDVGAGGVLMTGKGDDARPVMYFSKTLTATQRRWSTFEQEGFAIYFCVMKASQLLLGRQFTIHTDHRNLSYIQTATNAKVVRWRMALECYDYRIFHVPGQENGAADALSRLVELNVLETPANASSEQIAALHGGPRGHFGLRETLRLVRERFGTWSGMTNQIKDVIASCPTCQIMDRQRKEVNLVRHATAGTKPFAVVQFDTIGPLPEVEGKAYVIVGIDTFSKYVDVFPCTTTDAKSAAACLSWWTARYGHPQIVQTDNATQFKNGTLAALEEVWSLDHRYSTPYHPAGNGIVERVNSELARHLRTLVFDSGREWLDVLPLALFILNTTPDSRTGLAPTELLFDNKRKTPPDMLEKWANLCSGDLRPSVDGFRKNLQVYQELQRSELQASRGTQTKNITTFKEDQFVLLRPTDRVPKLKRRLRGPLRVVRPTDRPNVYVVRDLAMDSQFSVHAERLVPFTSKLPDNELLEYATRGTDLYVVADIVDFRDENGMLELLVDWEGYEPEERTWEPFTSDMDKLSAIDRLVQRHPDVVKLLRKYRSRVSRSGSRTRAARR